MFLMQLNIPEQRKQNGTNTDVHHFVHHQAYGSLGHSITAVLAVRILHVSL